jgi:hypothetical protein
MPINVIDLIGWRYVLNLSFGGACDREFGNTIYYLSCSPFPGMTCSEALPPLRIQRSKLTQCDQGLILGANPNDASALARESSISASCIGQNTIGQVTAAVPCTCISNVCLRVVFTF